MTKASVSQVDTPLHQVAAEHHQAGRLDQAQAAYQQILRLNSEDTQALYGLGLLALMAGEPSKAVSSIGKAVASQPNNGDMRLHLGIAYSQTGNISSAGEAFKEAVRLSPGNTNARYNLGLYYLNTGETKGAIQEFRRVTKKERRNLIALLNLGIAYIQNGNEEQAFRSFRRCLQLDPQNIDARLNLGNAFQGNGQFEEAMTEYKLILESVPEHAEANYNLGVTLKMVGDREGAIEKFRQVLNKNLDYIPALNNLGTTLYDFADKEEALNSLEMVTALEPENVVFRFNLAATQSNFDEWEKSENSYKVALEINRGFRPALNNLANLLRDTGRLVEAMPIYHDLVSSGTEFPNALSNYLFNLNYLCDDDNQQIYNESLDWNRRHGSDKDALRQTFKNDESPDRRLKVGYVSSDFYTHSISFFFEPLLSGHHTENIESYCYSNTIRHDQTTERLVAASDNWRSIDGLEDQQVADIIRSDRIDILVDLTGHSAKNRLPVFAMKPAPVLVSWLGYPNTTGLSVMDYRITDDIADPAGQSDLVHSEKLIRMPDGFLCYQPPSDSPEVSDPPHLKNGFITFGSFNNLAKLSPATIESWANILIREPESRLVIKGLALSSPNTRERYFELFEKCNVGRDRIDLLPRANTISEHLSLYTQIDIALDPFPYNGTTTTFEALWMGVPVICLMGNRHAARVSSSILTRLSLNEHIAKDPKDYVQRALALSENTSRLNEMRHQLRDKLKNSAWCDADDFVRRMEDCYKGLWLDWCMSRI